MRRRLTTALISLGLLACRGEPAYDLVIRGGTVYDGSGRAPVVADVAVLGDSIVLVGEIPLRGKAEIDARGWRSRPGSSIC